MSCSQWPGNGVHKRNPKTGACRGWRSRDWDLCMQISPWIIFTVTRWSVNCASHSQYNLRFFRRFSLILRSWTAARRLFRSLARCLAARNEAAPDTRTSQLHKEPPNAFFPQTHSARRVKSGEFGVSSDPVCSFPAEEEWPKRTNSVRGPRNERPPSPPSPL